MLTPRSTPRLITSTRPLIAQPIERTVMVGATNAGYAAVAVSLRSSGAREETDNTNHTHNF